MTANYAWELATALDGTPLALSAQEKADLSRAGQCFDAGRRVVPDSVWNKKGPPSPAEWREIRRHPCISTEASRSAGKPLDLEVELSICSAGPHLTDGARAIVRHHSEKFDGTGYPDQLKGGEIPRGAQVLGLAEQWNSLTSPRPFRAARNYAYASCVLRNQALIGTVDSALVTAFLERVVPGPRALEQRLLQGSFRRR